MVMPPPPPGLLGPGPGQAPPGGGPPPTGPMPPGPRGNVPEVSNERRPGLSYNAALEAAQAHDVMSLEQLSQKTQEWPEDLRKRAAEIWHEVTGAEPNAKVAQVEGNSETENPDTWILGSNQQQIEEAGEPAILEGRKPRVTFQIAPEKRYSLIDPLAETKDE